MLSLRHREQADLELGCAGRRLSKVGESSDGPKDGNQRAARHGGGSTGALWKLARAGGTGGGTAGTRGRAGKGSSGDSGVDASRWAHGGGGTSTGNGAADGSGRRRDRRSRRRAGRVDGRGDGGSSAAGKAELSGVVDLVTATNLKRIVGLVGQGLGHSPGELATSGSGGKSVDRVEVARGTLAEDKGGGDVVSWGVGDLVRLAGYDAGGGERVDGKALGHGGSDEGGAGEDGLETHVGGWNGWWGGWVGWLVGRGWIRVLCRRLADGITARKECTGWGERAECGASVVGCGVQIV